jgi:AAHS family 4-hydroxybenzoate transporter-like MFS transporter
MNETKEVDVAEFINRRRISAYQWLILAICTFIVAVDGLDLVIISFIIPGVAHDWGVPAAAFGPVVSAGLFGVAVGALFVGPISDRKGRKPVIFVAMVLCAVGTFGALISGSITTMVVWRFIAGIGLGAALPNVATIMAEYSPERSRARLLAAMYVGFSLGAASAGFSAAKLLPLFGWKGMLVLGGALPAICAALVLAGLPESVRFMVVQSATAEHIGRVLSRLGNLSYGHDTKFTLPEMKGTRHAPISGLFKNGLALGSVLLWLAYFTSLLVYYMLTSWLPSLLVQSGQPISEAAVVSAVLMIGGAIGSLSIGYFMDKFRPNYVVATAFLLATLLLLFIGRGLDSLLEFKVCAFFVGVLISGPITSMNTIAAEFYPTQSRASGVSWMLGIGRFGGILGAMLGAQLLAAGWGVSAIFMVLAIPALISGLALAYKGMHYGNAHTSAKIYATSYH